MSLRTRLALVFIAATLIPLGATVWLTTLLLNQSLRQSPVNQLSDLSRYGLLSRPGWSIIIRRANS